MKIIKTILGLLLLTCLTACPIVRGTGNAIEATGDGVGHAVEGVGEGVGDAVEGTGRAIGQTGRELAQ